MSSAPIPRCDCLSALGQSVWIDFLSRESIRGGHLQELLDDDSVVGATSNPSIFQKAMASGDAYDEQLARARRRDATIKDVFWALAEQDIREACDAVPRRSGTAAAAATATSRSRSTRGLAYDTLDDLPRSDAPARVGRHART